VQSQGLSRRVAIAGLVALVISICDVAAVTAAVRVMACCAKKRGDCAGVKTPDDCCRSKGHVATVSAGTLPPTSPSTDAPLVLDVLPAATCLAKIAWANVLVDAAFKRPHDPPHLHPVALLI
jgi:hypothetical protein